MGRGDELLENFLDLTFYFTIYSFLGWSAESIYASIDEEKFVNRGFLGGFFCPIYGFGAILIITATGWVKSSLSGKFLPLLIGLLLSILLVTALEYATGLILEKFFKTKWWDYSNDFGNINGYVCIKNSLLWGGLAFLLIQFMHPLTVNVVSKIPDINKSYIGAFLILFFTVDTLKSVIDTLGLRKVILNYANFPEDNYKNKIIKYRRFFLAFPRLLILNAEIINRDVRSILNESLDKIVLQIKNRL